MNKNEFSALIAEKLNITKKDSLAFVNEFCAQLGKVVKKEGELKFTNLGTFKLKTTKARKGINPRTKETVSIPAKKTVTFKASKELLDNIR